MKEIEKRKLGFRIRLIREEKNISHEELASKMGVTTNYIYKVEAGKSGFTLDTLHKFAAALDVKISDFYIWEDQPAANRVKDVEIGWERNIANSDYLKLIVPKIMEIIQQYGVPIPMPEVEKYPQQQQLVELILKLPDDLKKQIAQKIMAEFWQKVN